MPLELGAESSLLSNACTAIICNNLYRQIMTNVPSEFFVNDKCDPIKPLKWLKYSRMSFVDCNSILRKNNHCEPLKRSYLLYNLWQLWVTGNSYLALVEIINCEGLNVMSAWGYKKCFFLLKNYILIII